MSVFEEPHNVSHSGSAESDLPRTEAKKRPLLAATAGALLLATGLGGVALGQASAGTEPSVASPATSEAETDPAALRSVRPGADIEDLSLDELSAELARLGLEVDLRITPSAPDTDDHTGTDVGTDAAEVDSAEVDPFAGMTDAEIDALSDEEFFERLDAAGIEPEWIGDDQGSDPFDQPDDGDDGDVQPLAAVAVDGDSIDTSGLTPEVAEQTSAIWQRFIELIPAEQRQMVSGFELLDENYQGAHVYPDDADPTKWTLGVGLGLGDDLDYVLIHEFGHLLTLQAKEVPPGDGTGSCPTYHTGEGCALQGSTMAEFVRKFWPQDMRDKVLELYDSGDEEGLEAFYQENKDRFVTDYAASNPAEDLAETFAVFVTEARPAGDTVADQKVQLLWSDSAMVELRTQIRAAL